MITPHHFTEALTRLQELDHLTDHPILSEEWWATFAAEVGVDVETLQKATDIACEGKLNLYAGAVLGLLLGLLAARYSAATEPSEIL